MYSELLTGPGSGIAQAVSRWLPTAVAQVQAQVRSCGICGEQYGIAADFLRVLQFTLPIPSIIQHWYNRPNSGQRTKWTQSHPTPRNKTDRVFK
jgi:hypothetical protein